jgi:hypothetical protein
MAYCGEPPLRTDNNQRYRKRSAQKLYASHTVYYNHNTLLLHNISTHILFAIIQGDQKVSVHLMIPVQKNTQKYFKQFQSLTMITYLELGITDGVSVSLVSP